MWYSSLCMWIVWSQGIITFVWTHNTKNKHHALTFWHLPALGKLALHNSLLLLWETDLKSKLPCTEQCFFCERSSPPKTCTSRTFTGCRIRRWLWQVCSLSHWTAMLTESHSNNKNTKKNEKQRKRQNTYFSNSWSDTSTFNIDVCHRRWPEDMEEKWLKLMSSIKFSCLCHSLCISGDVCYEPHYTITL